jgi:hypothetical protein
MSQHRADEARQNNEQKPTLGRGEAMQANNAVLADRRHGGGIKRNACAKGGWQKPVCGGDRSFPEENAIESFATLEPLAFSAVSP